MEFIKKNFKYIFIFLFAFFCMSFFLTYFDGDVLWNYGFGYAISRGEVPYRDFNMVLTPAYPFLMSLFLLINSNVLIFYLVNSFIITYIFYLLFKMYAYKAWVLLILLVFPIPAVIFPSYNLFLVLLVILLIYLEKNNGNDYLIGFLIAISALTKQSVGVFFIIPTLIYYRKEIKKIVRRSIGFIIPCLIFLIYLIVTGSFNNFFDLCLFGLFDFTDSNGSRFNISLIIGLILIISSFILFLKNKKDIKYLYIFLFSSIMIPIFDYPHIEYFFFVFSLLLIDKIKISKRGLIFNSILFSSAFSFIFFYNTLFQGNINYPNHYNNFNFRLLYDKNGENIVRDKVIKYIKDNKDKDIVMLASDSYFYKITCEMDITHFDLINKGNHGYNGTEKMKKKLEKLKKGTILIIDTNEVNSDRKDVSIQFNRELARHGIKLGKEIKKLDGYTVYVKE